MKRLLLILTILVASFAMPIAGLSQPEVKPKTMILPAPVGGVVSAGTRITRGLLWHLGTYEQ